MTSSRQDAWTQDEDLLLADLVLRYIRDGGTQLNAFEEVGRRLSRTAAACGFRWNSYVRKQYKAGIDLAKKQRKQLKAQHSTTERARAEAPRREVQSSSSDLTLRDVIHFLENLEITAENANDVVKLNVDLKKRVEGLERHIQRLEKEKHLLQNNLVVVEDDYKALIEIMERARKMVVLKEDEKSEKVKFQVDQTSKLKKIEK
ncbi:RsfA family transcriptional regulator [Priestia koreensis]|uniref:Uncharacterized protein n=1 Tax=Priestia koreensis TaxID=284581 RepID=A0A0M0KQ50_9BACI|nr:RsfA family transcriptional regulator [Priestia koreensis]KOO40752.1 hypothetical protein AMD01_20825 [Priestia koreensis]